MTIVYAAGRAGGTNYQFSTEITNLLIQSAVSRDGSSACPDSEHSKYRTGSSQKTWEKTPVLGKTKKHAPGVPPRPPTQ